MTMKDYVVATFRAGLALLDPQDRLEAILEVGKFEVADLWAIKLGTAGQAPTEPADQAKGAVS